MSNATIHRGMWINNSKGTPNERTWTVSTQQGNYVIAFLALLVAWTGNYFWDILCYVSYNWRATHKLKDDAFYLQHQTILRSGVSSSSALWKFWKMFWYWRPHIIRPYSRSIPLGALASVHIGVIIVGSIFSSKLANLSNEVLLVSPTCGWISERAYEHLLDLKPEDLPFADALFVTANWYFQRSLEYAKSCYGFPAGATSTLCGSYIKPRLVSSVDRSAPCPFQPGACRTSAIAFDSGLMDANHHLGVNVPFKDTLSLRKVTTCAPIHGEGVYDSGWTTARPNSNASFKVPPTNRVHFGVNYTALFNESEFRYYHFGPSLSFGTPLSNATFMFGRNWLELQNREYILTASTAFLGNPPTCNGCDFFPIADFNRTDADVTLLGLLNLATYTARGEDPWFQPTTETGRENKTIIWYTTTNMSFVGCAEQYQFCSHNHCGPLTGLYALMQAKDAVAETEQQSALFNLLWKAIWATRIQFLNIFLAADVLRANDNLYRLGFLSSAPERDHWQLEMENINNVSLAFLQRRFVDFADPPALQIRPGGTTTTTARDYLQLPAEQAWFCDRVKIRSADHTSFNVAAFAGVCVGCFLVMLCGVLLPKIAPRVAMGLRSRRRATEGPSCRTTSWTELGILQLLRTVLEARGIGPWTGKDEDVPVIEKGAAPAQGTELVATPIRRSREDPSCSLE